MASLDDKKFLQRLGERVRKRREERGLTQQQLGDQCDLHRTFIGSVERGERNVSVLNVRRLAVVLRTTPAELLG
ncbi:MAG: helix-turn-helix transcriptional regulator [Planctomycetales bacterium]|jgi:transcriptional regulator with XRE-family HTH domain|nr:helix-turn-helix transcriptional regulator [Planctomycetales bacterium]MBN8624713.1 helix-turn-helix transcriptional regulator [Planctomycetota bacterium]